LSGQPFNPTLSGMLSIREVEVLCLKQIQGHIDDFDTAALRLFDFQRENNAAYRAFCATRPEPARWEEIPFVPLGAFRQSPLICFPEQEITRTFWTSGTTGEATGKHHFQSLSLYHAAAMKGWELAGLGGCEVLTLVPHPSQAPHSSLSQMASWLAPHDQFFFAQWAQLANRIKHDRPVILFGTALAFLDFFEWLGARRLTLAAGSLAVETGGYKGTQRDLPKEALYELFSTHLGLPYEAVINEYGMTELSSQCYARGLGTPHVAPTWVRVLVVDPTTGVEVEIGDTGVLRILDLANVGSVCAIQTQDLATRASEGFHLIGRDPAALPRGCSRLVGAPLS